MKTHTTIKIAVLLAVVASALGGLWQTASANTHLQWYSLEAGKTIEIGKQGIAVGQVPLGVTGVAAGVIKYELPARYSHKVDVGFRPPALEVRFMNQNGGYIAEIEAPVYVFFNIGAAEQSLWFREGSESISIWRYNELDDIWEQCPTFFVPENLDNGQYNRLACISPGSGIYVLGHVGFDELLFTPYIWEYKVPKIHGDIGFKR